MVAEESTADGHITAVILEPVDALAMIGLMLREALGQLGEADSIERIACPRLVVTPSDMFGPRTVTVAYDGEGAWMNAPVTLRVLPEPLWLLMAVRRTSQATWTDDRSHPAPLRHERHARWLLRSSCERHENMHCQQQPGSAARQVEMIQGIQRIN